MGLETGLQNVGIDLDAPLPSTVALKYLSDFALFYSQGERRLPFISLSEKNKLERRVTYNSRDVIKAGLGASAALGSLDCAIDLISSGNIAVGALVGVACLIAGAYGHDKWVNAKGGYANEFLKSVKNNPRPQLLNQSLVEFLEYAESLGSTTNDDSSCTVNHTYHASNGAIIIPVDSVAIMDEIVKKGEGLDFRGLQKPKFFLNGVTVLDYYHHIDHGSGTTYFEVLGNLRDSKVTALIQVQPRYNEIKEVVDERLRRGKREPIYLLGDNWGGEVDVVIDHDPSKRWGKPLNHLAHAITNRAMDAYFSRRKFLLN